MSLNLDSLLSAIYNSVIEAQKLTEQQHMRVLNRYFYNENDKGIPKEDIGKPVMAEVQLPYLDKDDKGDDKVSYKVVEIPLLSLTPPSSLKIKNMKVEFDAQLLGFDENKAPKKGFSLDIFKRRKRKEVAAATATTAENVDKTKEENENEVFHKGPILLDLNGINEKQSGKGQKGVVAKLAIEFENSDPPEAIAKINDHIVRTFPF